MPQHQLLNYSKIKVSSEDLELSKTLSSFEVISVLQALNIIANKNRNSIFFIIKLVYLFKDSSSLSVSIL